MKTLRFILVVTLIILLAPACKKKDSNQPTSSTNNNNGTGITSKFYFQATIGGQLITFQDGVNGYGCGAGSSGGTVSAGYQEIQSSGLQKPLQAANQAGFAIMKTFSSSPSGTEIESMFGINSYTYGKDDNNAGTAVDGAQIFYSDASGTYWTTDLGTADQTGGTFSITEHIVNTDGWSHKISKAIFSCKLYDGNGNSKTLTNGICRGRTVQY